MVMSLPDLADAAVKLQTARNIGGLPFDGTANIDLGCEYSW